MRQECSESTREKRIATYTIKSNQSVNYRSKDVRRMNPTTESWISYGTLTWYASKYKTHNSADTSSASCFISHLATHLGMNCSFVEFGAVSGLRLRFSQRQECFKDIFDWVWIKFTFWHCWVLDFFCVFLQSIWRCVAWCWSSVLPLYDLRGCVCAKNPNYLPDIQCISVITVLSQGMG